MAVPIKRAVKALAWILAAVVVLFIALLAYVEMRWDAKTGRRVPDLSARADSPAVARGEYIFKYQAMCWDCHSDGSPDATSPPAGGKRFDLSGVGPGFGVWYASNITPDTETGLGTWSDAEVIQSIREGIRKDRTALFPIMPMDWYHGISDDDARALAAYMRSLPPIPNRVPANEPSLVAKALFAFGVLKPAGEIVTAVGSPPRGATADYGKYLAGNLSGCMDCHTPRDLSNGRVFFDSLGAGSTIDFGAPEGDPLVSYATNITPDKQTGIGNWSEDEFVRAMKVGLRPDGTVLDPHMPYAYYKSWAPEDLKALFLYLRSLPPIRRSTPPVRYSAELLASRGTARGRLLFHARCSRCHGEDGKGAQPTGIKLAEVAGTFNESGLKEFIRTGDEGLAMPGFGKTLTDPDLNDLVAFIRTWKTTRTALWNR